MKQKFFTCKECGNIITFIEDKGVPVSCCGERMEEIIPGSVDAAAEKHVPVAEESGNKVKVTTSTVGHPMLDEHFIQWISIETEQGNQIKYLKAKDEPAAEFLLSDEDKFIAAYSYCNLHGLWKMEASETTEQD